MEETDKNVTALALQGVDDLFEADVVARTDVRDAGAGAEMVESSDVQLPRIVVLQALSKPVVNGLPGAKPGVFWLTPHNRPVTFNPDEKMTLVVVKIIPAQRKWNPIDEGGGLVCEAAGGDYIAREPMGVCGAKLVAVMGKPKGGNSKTPDEVVGVTYEGGSPTNDCRACQYGLGAGPNGWLPKIIKINDESVTLPDRARRPVCTHSQDMLVLVALPKWEGMAQSVEPAFMSFARSGTAAGKQLSGMITMAVGEPAWSKLFQLGLLKTTNEYGTFFVPSPSVKGYAKEALVARAKSLYTMASEKNLRPAADPDGGGVDVPVDVPRGGGEGGQAAAPPPRDDEQAPEEKF